MRSGGEVEEQDEQSRVLYELCAMISHVLRTPPLPISFPAVSSRTSRASPAAFASLFLGISVALMLFGSVTFVIGIFLMPVVIALVMLFYFVGMLYNLSELGRTILWPDCSTTPPVPAGEALILINLAVLSSCIWAAFLPRLLEVEHAQHNHRSISST